MICLLFVCPKARGHKSLMPKEMILSAADKLELEIPTPNRPLGEVHRNKRLFLHTEFHNNEVSRRRETRNNFSGTGAEELEQVTRDTQPKRVVQVWGHMYIKNPLGFWFFSIPDTLLEKKTLFFCRQVKK